MVRKDGKAPVNHNLPCRDGTGAEPGPSQTDEVEVKKKKRPWHFGGFYGPLPCNGSFNGVTTKRPNEVTCKRCKAMIKKFKWKHPNDVPVKK